MAKVVNNENNSVKTKELTVNGKNFTLQHPGVRWYTRHQDNCMTAKGVLNSEKYIEGLFEYVIIDAPEEMKNAKGKVDLDSFDDCYEDLEVLGSEIERFLKGRK